MAEIINLGPVGFNPTGNYDNTHKYERLDVVYYEGSSYVALQESIGQLPTNTEYWDCIAVGYLKQNTYDSVAKMKADDTLKAGMYAQTVGYYSANDGGASTYKIRAKTNDDVIDEATIIEMNDSSNNLIAELILTNNVNVEQFGAYGDNTHDDTTAIQNCINYVSSNNKYKIIMNKEYLISSTINIIYDNFYVEVNGKITYNGNSGSALKVQGVHGRLYVDRIISSYDGILLEGNTTKNCAYNEFNFNYMLCNHNGLVEFANNGWLQYNEIRFKNIRADNICIHLKATENTNSWITETKYWGGHMSAKSYGSKNEYCIYFEQSSNLRISTQKFYNVGFEGTKIGAYLYGAQSCVFENPRNRESIETYVFQLAGKCLGNEFRVNNFPLKYLDFSGLVSFSSGNKFTGTFMTDGSSLMRFTEFAVDHEGMKYCNQKDYIYFNAGSGATLTLDSSKGWRGFPTQILMGNEPIKLDTKYYNWENINQFILTTGAINDTNKIITDVNDNALFDLSGLGYKKLRITIMQQTQTWATGGYLIEEITPIVHS